MTSPARALLMKSIHTDELNDTIVIEVLDEPWMFEKLSRMVGKRVTISESSANERSTTELLNELAAQQAMSDEEEVSEIQRSP